MNAMMVSEALIRCCVLGRTTSASSGSSLNTAKVAMTVTARPLFALLTGATVWPVTWAWSALAAGLASWFVSWAVHCWVHTC